MQSVKEGGKERQGVRERLRERACLDREKIPCRGSQGLKSSAKEGVLSSLAPTHTHAHTPSRPFCYTWSPLSFLVPHTPHSKHIHHPHKHTAFNHPKHTTTKTRIAATLWLTHSSSGYLPQQIKLIIPNLLCQVVWSSGASVQISNSPPLPFPLPPSSLPVCLTASLLVTSHKKTKNSCQLTSRAKT